MSSYLALKIIALVVMLVILVAVLVSRKADKAKSKKPSNCVGFDLPTHQEAYEHFLGHLTVVKDYGSSCNGHDLYTHDNGWRRLCRCKECGGLVLWQFSENYDYDHDYYYDDFFLVDSEEEADSLNERYDGWKIETEYKGKRVFVTTEYPGGKIISG